MATWTKLKSGEWGVKIDGVAKEGQSVTVKKKSGEEQTVIVKKVVWAGNGVSLCAIESRQPAMAGGGNRRSSGNVCAECGRGGSLVADLEDGLMKHYRCCDIPPSGY